MLKLWAALSGSKTYLVGLAGIIAPIAAAIHGDMSYQAAAGIVTPSLLAMCIRHGVSSSVATIAAAVLSNAAQAADSATKKTAPVLLAAILLASQLTACSPAQLAQVQTDITAGVAAACTDVATAAKINPTSPIVVYGEAACPLGVAASSLVQNSATIQWLGGIAAQIQATPAVAVVAPAKP